MSEEEINVCAQCGKNIQNKRGSLTQWVGLGDQCQCALARNSNTVTHFRKNEPKCRRCLKPKGKRQSMTQWLFNKDVCACADKKETVAPIKIALPNLPRPSKNASKNSSTLLLIFGTIVSVALIAFLISELDIHSVFSFKMPHSNGSDRILICGSDLTRNQREMKFDGFAPAYISRGEYPYIRLRDSLIEDGELKKLAQISSLRGITLQNCMGFSTYGIGFLAGSLDLTYLSLAQCQVSQGDLDVLQYSNLNTLDLSETPIADLDWTNLLKNPNLRKIILRKVYITNKNKNLFEIAGFLSSGGETFVR